MNEKGIIELYLIWNLIGFTAGTLITLLLLGLTLRAVKFPGKPVVNILHATCALFWNVFGLIHSIGYLIGLSPESKIIQLAFTIRCTSASLWPITMIILWRQFQVHTHKHAYSRVLQTLAMITGTILTLLLWTRFVIGTDLSSINWLKELVAYNGVILALCAIRELKGRYTSRVVWISCLSTLAALLISTLSMTLLTQVTLNPYITTFLSVISTQSPLLIVLGSFFLFARFRYSDQMIKYSLRILLVCKIAIILVITIDLGLLTQLANLTAYPNTAYTYYLGITLALMLVSFAIADRGIRIFVDRKIFRAPDYREAIQVLNNELNSLKLESDMIIRVKAKIKSVLEIDDITSINYDDLPGSLVSIELASKENIEIDSRDPLRKALSLPNVELLIPVVSRGNVIALLAISPGPARRGLVTHEINFIRTIASLYGNRIDSLRSEQETLARQQQESTMRQQLSEAKLHALRAQINPHFLFNALNSLANLIVIDPNRAETMTLRLAEIFRYVLMHSSRSMVTIREEIDFLRTYLHIEEARFGDRLRVEITTTPNSTSEIIPSLILQPIVENALKHGLASKPGNGHLHISTTLEGDFIKLQVEDNGIGLNDSVPFRQNLDQASHNENGGVGLKNVTERLWTLYKDKAFIDMAAGVNGGTKVTVILPRTTTLESL